MCQFGSKFVQEDPRTKLWIEPPPQWDYQWLQQEIKSLLRGESQKKVFNKRETPIGVSTLQQPTSSTSPSSIPRMVSPTQPPLSPLPRHPQNPTSHNYPCPQILYSFPTQQPTSPGSYGNPPKLSKRDNGWAATACTAQPKLNII